MNRYKNFLSFIGLSHLGLVTSFVSAKLGFNILALDQDKKLIQDLGKNRLPLFEPGLEKLFKEIKKNLEFSDNFSKLSDISCIIFAQDTSTDGTGSVKKLESLIDLSIPHLKNGVTIILMSQVPIGFCRHLKQKIAQRRSDIKFDLYHFVDTIIMTKAIERFLYPERIIIGADKPKSKISQALLKVLKKFECPKLFMSYESAELTKASINLYLANSVCFANTLSDFCEATGADINEIIQALALDKRIGPYAYLKPSLRISGGHLERDILMLNRLSKKHQIYPGVVNSIINLDKNRYKWAITKIKLNIKKNPTKPKISIWGLAYKKNTDSITNAASLKVIKDLSKDYQINIYDPMAKLPSQFSGIKVFTNKYQALEKSDCLLILTDWDEFKKANLSKIKLKLKEPLIIDSVGVLYSKIPANSSFNYISMGVG